MNSMPPRHDERLEPVGAHIGQHFQHGLVDQFVVTAAEAGVLRGREPVLTHFRELLRRHARMRRGDDFGSARLSGSAEGRHIAFEHRLERLLVLPFRMLRRQRLDPIEGERELDVNGLLDPERAVIVERGDPLGPGG